MTIFNLFGSWWSCPNVQIDGIAMSIVPICFCRLHICFDHPNRKKTRIIHDHPMNTRQSTHMMLWSSPMINRGWGDPLIMYPTMHNPSTVFTASGDAAHGECPELHTDQSAWPGAHLVVVPPWWCVEVIEMVASNQRWTRFKIANYMWSIDMINFCWETKIQIHVHEGVHESWALPQVASAVRVNLLPPLPRFHASSSWRDFSSTCPPNSWGWRSEPWQSL